jgi:uncharacterized membrane protein YozB (DUF420 family)
MVLVSIVQLISVVIYNFTDIIKSSDYDPSDFLDWLNLIVFVFCIIFLCILIYAMYRHHRLEFQRLMANFFIELLFYMIYLSSQIFQIIIFSKKDIIDENH